MPAGARIAWEGDAIKVPTFTGGEDNKFAFYKQTISCVKSVTRNIHITWLRAKGDKGFEFDVIA